MNPRLLMIFLAGWHVLAAHAADPDNRLTNPWFDTDLSGWDFSSSSIQWRSDDADGLASSGSFEVAVGGDIAVGATQCLDIPDIAVLGMAAESRQLGGSSGRAVLSASWYSDPGCSSGAYLSGATDSFNVGSAWEAIAAEFTPPASAASARLFIGALSTGGLATVRLDNIYGGPGKLFADRFETR